jgi:hypothetical protein
MRRRQPLVGPFHRVVAGIGVALVLALTVLAVCPSLHAWLHGEEHLDNDDGCAVVLFIHGATVAAATAIVAAVTLRATADRLPAPAELLLGAPRFQFPPGCGPPAN